MTMNEYDIDEAVDHLRGTPAHRYAKFLADWKDVVNSNSDGWAYWRAGRQAGSGLADLVQLAIVAKREHWSGKEAPTEAAFEKSLRSIRSAATRNNLTAPTLGDAPEEEAAPVPGR